MESVLRELTMYHGTLVQNQVYIVKLRGRLVQARFNSEHTYDPHFNSNAIRRGRSITHYRFTNLETGREITLKSKVKIVRVRQESDRPQKAETRE